MGSHPVSSIGPKEMRMKNREENEEWEGMSNWRATEVISLRKPHPLLKTLNLNCTGDRERWR